MCLYIFGVYCDAAVPGSSSCAYIVTAQTDGGSLPRLFDGVPVSVSVAAGAYKYFTLAVPAGALSFAISATVYTGAAQLLLAERRVVEGANGTTSVARPVFGAPASYLRASVEVPPSIVYQQPPLLPPSPPLGPWLGNTTSSAAPPMRYYTVGVFAPGGLSTELTLRAFWYQGPVILVPNQQVRSRGGALCRPLPRDSRLTTPPPLAPLPGPPGAREPLAPRRALRRDRRRPLC